MSKWEVTGGSDVILGDDGVIFAFSDENANLIAAAPDLLSALQHILSAYQSEIKPLMRMDQILRKGKFQAEFIAISKAQQAIQKALGK